MSIIRIGKKYQKEFESIVALYQSNCLTLANSHILSATENVIRTDQGFEFDFDRNLESIETSNPATIHDEGASWFDRFRNGNADQTAMDEQSQWINLINDVSTDYHRKFSFLEYKTNSDKNDSSFQLNDSMARQEMKNFVRAMKLLDDNEEPLFELADSEEEKKDIFAVAYRLDLCNGPRETRPFLGETYFSVEGNDYVPLERKSALEIQSRISGAVSSGEGEFTKLKPHSNTDVNLTLKAFENVATQENFADYIVYFDDEDKNVLKKLIEEGDNAQSTIRCKKVHILSIHHVKWEDIIYYYKKNNQRVLRFSFSSQNMAMSVFCHACNAKDNVLVSGNVILINNQPYRIDPSDENLGFGDKINGFLDLARKSGPFAHHFFRAGPCNRGMHPRLVKVCSRIKCDANSFTDESMKDTKGNLIKFCKDCPYREIVTRIAGKPYLTKNLKLAHPDNDEDYECPSLIPLDEKQNRNECPCCGRLIVSGKKYCQTCSDLVEGRDKKEGKALFAKYRQFLPIHLRGKDGLAAEDASQIVFYFATRDVSYVIHKQDIADEKTIKLDRNRKVKSGGQNK